MGQLSDGIVFLVPERYRSIYLKMKLLKLLMTSLIYSTIMTLHKSSTQHPESPARLVSLIDMVEYDFPELIRLTPRKVTKEEFLTAHTEEYYMALHDPHELMKMNWDPDMFYNDHTLEAALIAAGSTCQLVNTILHDGNNTQNGFALVRPPGHHARSGKCAGFCYVNNVMVAALSALRHNSDLKILVVDWDVHYHSGTADIIQKQSCSAEQLTVLSLHRYDNGKFYPGDKMGATGTYSDGRIVNIGFDMRKKGPVPGDALYTETLQKFTAQYQSRHGRPDIILVSCGFDAARGDPLGGFDVTPKGYGDMTKILKELCPKVAIVLEGGYNVPIITECAKQCIIALDN